MSAPQQPRPHYRRDREIRASGDSTTSYSFSTSYTVMDMVSARSQVKTGPTCFTTIYLPSTSTYHREKSILPGSLLMWYRGVSQLYSPYSKEKLKAVKELFYLCVDCVISWPLRMQLILIANTERNIMSSAFLLTPNPPPPSKMFILEDCCNTIKSWVA